MNFALEETRLQRQVKKAGVMPLSLKPKEDDSKG